MSSSAINSDDVINEFLVEAEEILQRLYKALPELEKDDFSADIIDAIYRDMHTLKGSSQLFGFKFIGLLAHAMEANLESVRKNKVKVHPDFVDILFKSLDIIARILKDPQKDLTNDPELQEEVFVGIPKLIVMATKQFSAELEPVRDNFQIDDQQAQGQIQSGSIQSSSPQKIQIEMPIQKDSGGHSDQAIAPLLEDKIAEKNIEAKVEPKLEAKLESKPEIKIEPKVEPKLEPKIEAIPAQPAPKIESKPPAASAVNPKPTSAKPMTKANDIHKNPHPDEHGSDQSFEHLTIRVQVGVLDKLMNLAGEMVLVRNQVLQYASHEESSEIIALSQKLDLVTSELQMHVMKTRMQPIGSALSKFQRMVRDLAKDLGKQIEFKIFGAETELDKSLIEAIKDPLTHIIRNSCDHGLEMPADRVKAGKSEIGSIQVKAFHEGGQVVIEIIDDGRGLNPDKIKAKALEKKLITPERAERMSAREIQNLIFAHGFSTAEQVTSVSGRGVGMDVVKTNLEKVNGQIDLVSEAGKGTTIRLRIPLTLAIVPALVIKSRNEVFTIPQVKLHELVRVDMNEDQTKVESLQGQPVYRLRDQLLPLVCLDQVLSGQKNKFPEARSIYNIAVLSGETRSFGLVVDEILETADIVVKPLTPFLKSINLYSGSTILGNGDVALILDVAGLANHAHIVSTGDKTEISNALGTTGMTKSSVLSEGQDYLFFSVESGNIFCIPLVLVQRLEEFSAPTVKKSGKDRVVKYRDALLPLISLNQYLGLEKGTKSNSEKISVIVIAKRNRFFGIEVNEILDVQNVQRDIQALNVEMKGILGSLIVNDNQVSSVIDALGIIEDIIGPDVSATKEPETGKKKKLKPTRVLFAEDTKFFAKQVIKILNELGCETTHCPDGFEALKMLTSKPDQFDLVVSDIEMPNMTGYELAEAIRKEEAFKNLPMIALTTRFREDDVARGKQVGFNKYLEKLKSDQLVDAIFELRGQ